MKNLLFLILVFINVPLMGQNKTTGAYLSTNKDINRLFLISTNYLSIITYKDNTYLGTLGGPITNDENAIQLSIEYHDQYPDSVGLKKIIPIQLNNNRNLKIDGLQVIKTKHKQQDLDGLWRITGRQAGDKMNAIPKRDRKTIKILVDGYFQWVAINPAEKGFYGTGGGNYIFDNGKYSENIVFFSRDNARVGHTLDFEGTLKENQWHHQGKSSKGAPIYEVWTKEE